MVLPDKDVVVEADLAVVAVHVERMAQGCYLNETWVGISVVEVRSSVGIQDYETSVNDVVEAETAAPEVASVAVAKVVA